MTGNGNATKATERSGSSDGRDGFRPDIEGLRAIAVGLVLAFHAGIPRITGGYVGVDVFFVLSGFLITGLLVREIARTGTVSLTGFYARRIRRLLPAAALLVAVTVIASAVVLPPLRAADVAGDGVAAALYVSNIRFAAQATDYLQSQLPPSPLLHLWSLGVEEQFYLFWPALLLLVARGRAGLLRRVGILSAVVIVGSFVLSLWLTGANQPWAFFSLPTRAWELGLGAVLAVSATRLARLPRSVAVSAAWIGLAMIAASAFVIGTSTPFPGVAALLPTIGVALALLPGMRSGVASAPVRLLGVAPMRFFGRISYSLYLWHWPLIVLPVAMAGGHLPLVARVGLVILTVPIAYASRRWVEDPIRHGTFLGRLPRRSLVFAGVTSLCLVVASLGIRSTVLGPLHPELASVSSGVLGAVDPDPLGSFGPSAAPGGAGFPAGPGASAASASRSPVAGSAVPAAPPPASPGGPVPADLVPSLADARDDIPATYADGCHLDQPSTTIPTCAYGDPSSSTTVVLLGDSHAAQWFPALVSLAKQRGWRLVSLTKSACTPDSVTLWNTTFHRAYTECDTWREAAFARIRDEHPALVIVSSGRASRLAGPDGEAPPDGNAALRAGLDATLARLKPLAKAVALIADTPLFPIDPPECLSEHLGDVLACAEPRAKVTNAAWTRTEQQVADGEGVSFVDPTSWACPSEPCPVVVGRYLVFRDRQHLSTPYVLALRARLEAALPSPAG